MVAKPGPVGIVGGWIQRVVGALAVVAAGCASGVAAPPVDVVGPLRVTGADVAVTTRLSDTGVQATSTVDIHTATAARATPLIPRR
ncbi:MAG: hypothetical protein ABIS35_05215 [Terracoccus sp.]